MSMNKWGSHFHDLASHQFDRLEYTFGPIKEAKGAKINQAGLYPVEDAVSASFLFESRVIGTGSWGRGKLHHSLRRELNLV